MSKEDKSSSGLLSSLSSEESLALSFMSNTKTGISLEVVAWDFAGVVGCEIRSGEMVFTSGERVGCGDWNGDERDCYNNKRFF